MEPMTADSQTVDSVRQQTSNLTHLSHIRETYS